VIDRVLSSRNCLVDGFIGPDALKFIFAAGGLAESLYEVRHGLMLFRKMRRKIELSQTIVMDGPARLVSISA
jgi:hypothetical protein